MGFPILVRCHIYIESGPRAGTVSTGSCGICLWVEVQPLPLCSSTCWWKASGLWHIKKQKIMTWGAFLVVGTSELVVVDGTVKLTLTPCTKHAFLGIETFLKMCICAWQRHASYYMEHTQFSGREEAVVMQWPARRPDLNPNERIWTRIGLFIGGINRHHTTLAPLWEALLQAWGTVTPERMGILVQNIIIIIITIIIIIIIIVTHYHHFHLHHHHIIIISIIIIITLLSLLLFDYFCYHCQYHYYNRHYHYHYHQYCPSWFSVHTC